jgi:hypothetical protein
VAVTSGGPRATGTATQRSDWDFGLYYRGGIDTDAMNEKGIVERAGLGHAARAFTELDPSEAVDHVADLLAVGWV